MKKLLTVAATLLLTTGIRAQFSCGYEEPLSSPSFSPVSGLQAGSCTSHNGFCHTPKGNLHIMFVYVVFNNETPDADQSWWPVNDVPVFAALNGASNDLLD